MRYTVASLRCVPQSMQGVHRVIQSLYLFNVVSGYVKQLPCPYCKCFLCLRNAVWESGLINLKEGGLGQIPPRSAAQRFAKQADYLALHRPAGRGQRVVLYARSQGTNGRHLSANERWIAGLR